RQYHEHDNGTVNGNRCQVKVRIHYASFGPLAQEGFQDRHRLSGPSQLDTEKYAQHHSHQSHKETGNQELLGDHFMILAENIFRNERLLVMVMSMVMIVGVMCMICMCCMNFAHTLFFI